MFSSISYIYLQQLWWIVVSLIGGIFAFLFFVQGGQSLMFTVSKSELDKDLIINTLGRKWELGFTTLVLFGGAMFAAFPRFYAVSFGGAYWVWLAILVCFILQAISYEYRKKPDNFLGQKTYEFFLLINGFLGIFLLGAALSTLFSGAAFSLDSNGFVVWHTNLRGLEALFNPANYLLGLALVFLSRLLGAMYIALTVDNDMLAKRCYKSIKIEVIPFLVFFLSFTAWILLKSGYGYGHDQIIKSIPYKYLLNLVNMPLVALEFFTGVVLVLFGIGMAIFKGCRWAIWMSGVGTVLTVMAVLLLAGLNGTAFYPSTEDIQSSLTIINSSSSKFTLVTMTYIALFVPFVLGYVAYAWNAMNKKKITASEIDSDKSY